MWLFKKKIIIIPCSENSWVNYLLPQGEFLGVLLLLSLFNDYMQQHKGEFLCEEMQCLVNLKQHTAEEVGGRSKPLLFLQHFGANGSHLLFLSEAHSVFPQ